ncbi:MAG: hypothetical protein AAGJ86_00955 [Pseudomonadota bacterium]
MSPVAPNSVQRASALRVVAAILVAIGVFFLIRAIDVAFFPGQYAGSRIAMFIALYTRVQIAVFVACLAGGMVAGRRAVVPLVVVFYFAKLGLVINDYLAQREAARRLELAVDVDWPGIVFVTVMSLAGAVLGVWIRRLLYARGENDGLVQSDDGVLRPVTINPRFWFLVFVVMSVALMFWALHVQIVVADYCWQPGDFWLDAEKSFSPFNVLSVVVGLLSLWWASELLSYWRASSRQPFGWLQFVPVLLLISGMAAALVGLRQMINDESDPQARQRVIAEMRDAGHIVLFKPVDGPDWRAFLKTEACSRGYSPRDLPAELYQELNEAYYERFFDGSD